MKKPFNLNPKLLLRTAAACILFFALGHSLGHFTRHNVTDPQAIALQREMIENKFDMFGTPRSYDENYTGMSLNLIFTLLAVTVVLWQLSGQVEKHPANSRKVLIPLTLCVLGFGFTSAFYFFPMPAISCFVAAGALTGAIFRLPSGIVGPTR